MPPSWPIRMVISEQVSPLDAADSAASRMDWACSAKLTNPLSRKTGGILVGSKSGDGVDAAGSAGGEETREESGDDQEGNGPGERGRAGGLRALHQSFEKPQGGEGADES